MTYQVFSHWRSSSVSGVFTARQYQAQARLSASIMRESCAGPRIFATPAFKCHG